MDEVAKGLLEECIRFSRRLGADPSLVLHGGGNTSVKTRATDITRAAVELVHVKGSGHDLGTITESGFTPLRRARLLALASLDRLSDTDMVREVRQASLDPEAPRASIEALVHAIIPERFVLHSHADAIVTLSNASLDDDRLREILGPGVEVLPYCMPGFDLAKSMRALLNKPGNEAVSAVVHRHHGLFTFDDSGEIAYERHLELVGRARQVIGSPVGTVPVTGPSLSAPEALARLRREISLVSGQPMLLRRHVDPEAMGFISRPDLSKVVTRGTATLEHVIRTKAEPCLGPDVNEYARKYRERFNRFAARSRRPLTMLDPAPRVILDADLGFIVVGRTEAELGIVEDIYRHTMRIIDDAQRIGTYRSLNDADLFDIEYWELEQVKLTSSRSLPPLAGEVAVMQTGGGKDSEEIADSFRASGAQVVPLTADDDAEAIYDLVGRYGGIDIAVTPDGPERPAWWIAAHRFLELSFRGGRVVVHGQSGANKSVSVTTASQTARLITPALQGMGEQVVQLCVARATRPSQEARGTD